MADSKSFCILPWVHVSTKTNGQLRLCCEAQHSAKRNCAQSQHFQLGRETIADYWNSEYLREVRRKMCANESVPECRTCHEEEHSGKISKRIRENKKWRERLGSEIISRRIEASQKNAYEVQEVPIYFDLRLGNVCNLKCRMCDSFSSLSLAQETKELIASGENIPQSAVEALRAAEKMGTWFESPIFWQEVERFMPFIREVYLTGGEPTLIAQNIKFIRICAERGFAKNIIVRFNTNLTRIPEGFIEALQVFAEVHFSFSIDGVGEVNDFIRYPSRWNTIEKNLHRYLEQIPNGIFNIGPTLSLYNVFYLRELLGWSDELRRSWPTRNISVGLNMVYHPHYLDARLMTDSAKELLVRDISSYAMCAEAFCFGRDHILKAEVDAFLRWLKGPLENSHFLREQFLQHTKTLDKKRRQVMAEFLPRVVEAMIQNAPNIQPIPG